MLVHRMTVVSLPLFRKHFGNLREFFGQKVRHPRHPLAKKLPVRFELKSELIEKNAIRSKRLPGFPQRKIKDIQKKRRRQAARSKISRQLIKLPSCKALNLFQRPCKAKLLGESVFVKFISFITLYDIDWCTQIGATAFGRTRRYIKSVQSSEKYCTYHKIKI